MKPLRIHNFSFLLCLLTSIANSQPLLSWSTSQWDETTQLWVGNCHNSPSFPANIFVIKPPHPTDKNSDVLDMVPLPKKETGEISGLIVFCGAAEASANSKSTLSLFDVTGNFERVLYELPFSAEIGFLSLGTAYYLNEWHTVLLVMAKDKMGSQSVLLAFDVTEPVNHLNPFIHLSKNELSTLNTRPELLRLHDGQVVIAVGGLNDGLGVLHIVSIEPDTLPLQYPIDSRPIDYLMAVDLYQRGYADRLYIAAYDQLWGLDLILLKHNKIQKLKQSGVQILSKPLVILDAFGKGVQLYFLGESLQGKGLYRIQDPLQSLVREQESELLMSGDFAAGQLRYGHYWLIPRQETQKPIVLHLASKQSLSFTEQYLNRDSTVPNKSMNGHLINTKLLWDPKGHQEVLITLNDSCQLNIKSIRPSFDPYGRLTWQKST